MLLFAFTLPAMADWKIYKRAEVRSNNNNIMRIDRNSGGSVCVWFILNPKVRGVFESKLPLYQVDRNEVNDLQLARKEERDKDKSHWIQWAIYDGKGALSEDLLELMNGNEVVFQYYLPDGEIRESIFSLKGAKEAIEEVLR